ncbi:MAG: hypothetical protein U1E17_18375 [Geminicoccaceae bacterium]
MCATPWRPSPAACASSWWHPRGIKGSLLFYELFESEAAFAFHCGSEHLRWFREARAPFVQDSTVRECLPVAGITPGVVLCTVPVLSEHRHYLSP